MHKTEKHKWELAQINADRDFRGLERLSELPNVAHVDGVNGADAAHGDEAPADNWQPPIEIPNIETSSTPRRQLFRPVPIDLVQIGDEPQWLINGLIPTRGLVAIIGPPKCGKSFLTTDMLFSVPRGDSYAGRAVLPGPVVYLTGEGVQGFKRRMIALRRHYRVEGNGIDFFMVPNVPDLGSSNSNLAAMLGEIDEFFERTEIEPPRAIVLDTLARCMGDGDENVARDMGRFIHRCGEIERHYGCVVVVIHHMGKDTSKGARGSNALNGAADVTIEVEKGEAFSTARVDEMKDGREGQEWSFRLVPFEIGEASASAGADTAATATMVVELLCEPTLAGVHKTKPAKAPTGVSGDLLLVIRRAIEEMGEAGINGISKNIRAVSRSNLKNYCRTMAWQDPDGKPDLFRGMLSKNLSTLRSRGHVAFNAEWVWIP